MNLSLGQEQKLKTQKQGQWKCENMSDEQTYFIIEEILKGKVLTSLPIMGWKVKFKYRETLQDYSSSRELNVLDIP